MTCPEGDGPAQQGERDARPQDPDGTRQNIIEVAIKEFAEHGLSGARIDEIAAKTRSSKRMIYYYFGGKEGLYLKALEAAYHEVRDGEADLALDHLPPVDALRRLVEFTFDHHNTHQNFIRLVMIENIHRGAYLDQSTEIRRMNAGAIDRLAAIYRRGTEAGLFRSGLNPLELHWQISALCFFNVSNRATFSRIFGEDLDTAQQQAELRRRCVDTILRCVLTPAAITELPDGH